MNATTSGGPESPRGAGVFVYGFGPYGEFERNVTEAVVRALPPLGGLRTAVFPVRFDRAMLLAPVRSEPAEIIIGLGQCRRGRKLRLERKAVNLRAEPDKAPRPIARRSPGHHFATLPLARIPDTRVSYDAGTYVCNFSMFVMLEHCRRHGGRFGFVHIPKDHDVQSAVDYLTDAIRRVAGPRIREAMG